MEFVIRGMAASRVRSNLSSVAAVLFVEAVRACRLAAKFAVKETCDTRSATLTPFE